jgi:ribosomal protein L34E
MTEYSRDVPASDNCITCGRPVHGLIVLACLNAPIQRGESTDDRVAKGYHYLCADDFSQLEIVDTRGRRVRLKPCRTCGAALSGPKVSRLGSSVPTRGT